MTIRALRWTGVALAAVLLAPAAYVVAARAGWLRPDDAAMRERYGLPQSRYIQVGGQAVHLVDEGHGPVVVLVHGSFASLRMWDGWAASLRDHYRVIRFDRPGMGLSGPAPQGRYDDEAEAALIAALTEQLRLPRFVLVGTSSAGEAVAHFAATRPQALRGVVLANIAAGPLKPNPHLTPWFMAVLAFDGLLGGHHVPAFWGGVLRMNFANPALVTPALVDRWTNLNNRAQGWPHRPRPHPSFAGTPADLAAIRVPALVLWSDRDQEVPLVRDGQQTMRLLGSPGKSLAVVAQCGHMLAEECSARSVAPVRQFLDQLSGR